MYTGITVQALRLLSELRAPGLKVELLLYPRYCLPCRNGKGGIARPTDSCFF